MNTKTAGDEESVPSKSKQSQSLDDSSSGSGRNGNSSNSSTTGTSPSGQGNRGIPDAIFSAKETKAVNRSRLAVIAVLVFSAVAAGVMAFLLTTASETKDFETQVNVSSFCVAAKKEQYICMNPFV
jgi:hypothetical protein